MCVWVWVCELFWEWGLGEGELVWARGWVRLEGALIDRLEGACIDRLEGACNDVPASA